MSQSSACVYGLQLNTERREALLQHAAFGYCAPVKASDTDRDERIPAALADLETRRGVLEAELLELDGANAQECERTAEVGERLAAMQEHMKDAMDEHDALSSKWAWCTRVWPSSKQRPSAC